MPDRAALERQKRHAAALLGIATHEAVRTGDLERAVRAIHEVVADTLAVERVSTWLLTGDRHELGCVDLFELSGRRHASGETLRADDYPHYFQVLRSARAVDAHDARTDPRTSEFTHGYLEPRGITAVLDAPIRVSGDVVGVVWIEHVRTARTWIPDELVFAADVADQTAQAIVQDERARAEEALRASERQQFAEPPNAAEVERVAAIAPAGFKFAE
jgi:GAF domain-containing protein